MLLDSTDLIDTAAAARRCNLSYKVFVALRSAGKTPAPDSFRGARALYRPAALDEWMRARGGKKTWKTVPTAA